MFDMIWHGEKQVYSSKALRFKNFGFSAEQGSMLSLVLIKTRNAPIPTMKIRQNRILNRFFKTQLCGK